MNSLRKIALLGTGKWNAPPREENYALQNLLDQTSTKNLEDKLLIQAGNRALYQQAGWLPRNDVVLPTPAPEEKYETCSSEMLSLLTQVFLSEQKDLKLEVFQAYQQYQRKLPWDILPLALNVQDVELRHAIMPILGKRGRWLSQWNTDWHWAQEGHSEQNTDDIAALRRTWLEGNRRQRMEVLAALRKVDAGEGRQWFVETLPVEKADIRAELLEQLHVGLSLEDETVLEQLLDDRSTQVRQVASALLRELPGSAWVQRMQERASQMLQYDEAELHCIPPGELPADWKRDGISNRPPPGKGKKSYWVEAVLGNVPVSYWQRLYQTAPAKLLTAVSRDDYAMEVALGWTRALEVVPTNDSEILRWAHALWDYWIGHWQKDRKKNPETLSRLSAIMRKFPANTAEQKVLPFLVQGRLHGAALLLLLEALPRPWSSYFAQHYLQVARQVARCAVLDEAYEWLKSLEIAGRAIPASMHAAALEPWNMERMGQASWTITAIEQLLEGFLQHVKFRKLLHEEIAKGS